MCSTYKFRTCLSKFNITIQYYIVKFRQFQPMIVPSSSFEVGMQSGNQTIKYPQQQPQVKIYLRRTNKQAIAIHVSKIILAKSIFELAAKYFGFSEQFLMLMYCGQKIYPNSEGQSTQLVLNNNDIIHIHQSRSTDNKSIILYFKTLDCQDFENGKTVSLEVQHKLIIGQTISQFFNTSKYSFVQSGRKLDLTKTFEEQYVENQSTIIVTFFQHPRRFPQSPPKIVIRRTKSNQHIQDDSNVQMDIGSFVPKISLRKTVSWSSPESNKLQSFKKKKKTSAYKSMKIKDGKQVIWQSDSSTDNKQNVARKLALKKHKQPNRKIDNNQIVVDHQQIKSVSSQECEIVFSDEEDMANFQTTTPIFSVRDKIDLKNQLKKLLFSNSFSIQSEVSKLEPPQIIVDNFNEEVQQVQVTPKDDQMILTKCSLENTQTKAPVNLRQSIGKSKGLFLPIISTNKMTALEREDDDDDDDQEQQIQMQ